jgi:serine phosphatase RsbU (regulator of sigma subunit)/pSer/pThr/pTyr-binding forkhead associated (FHA) protein
MTLYLSGTLGDQPRAWKIEAALTTIGRSSACEIQIADASVSRRHAEIVRRGDRFFIRDLGSRNGTLVNGRQVHELCEFGPGDRIEVGDIELSATAEAPSQRLVIPEGWHVDTSAQLRADRLLERRAHEEHGAQPLVALLAAAGQLLVMPRSLPETCEEILDVIARAVPGSRHVLALRDEPSGELRQVASRHGGGRAARPLALSHSIVDRVLEECTSVLTADARADPRFRAQASVMLQGVHSAMAVPLFDNRKVLGLVYVDSQDLAVTFSAAQLEVLTLLANMAAVKISNVHLLEAEKERLRLAHELATAAQIQRALLPGAPVLEGWQIEAYLETCHEVGGDLYDCRLRRDGRVMFLVGDVSGKGIGAALLMSSFLASARAFYETCSDPGELATWLGDIVYANGDPSRFVTGFLGCLDTRTGTLHYANAGHPSAVLLAGGEMRQLESTGVPFGVLPNFRYGSGSTEICPGQMLAVFSDGIPEAQRGEEFFSDERLHQALVAASGARDLSDVRRSVLARLEAFLGDTPHSDDITLFLVRRELGQT